MILVDVDQKRLDFCLKHCQVEYTFVDTDCYEPETRILQRAEGNLYVIIGGHSLVFMKPTENAQKMLDTLELNDVGYLQEYQLCYMAGLEGNYKIATDAEREELIRCAHQILGV